MTSTHHADAELIALGQLLVAGFYAETNAIAKLKASGQIDDDEKLDAACAPLQAVLDQINQYQAQTSPGFYVLELADRWVNGTLPLEFMQFSR
jgi:hypothetical protein